MPHVPLDREAVEDFRKLYQDEYGEDLSFEAAAVLANDVFELYTMLYVDPPELWTRPDGAPPEPLTRADLESP